MDHYQYVMGRYISRGKKYHNIDHINRMIKDYHLYFRHIESMPESLYHAILWHDYVYEIPAIGEKLEISNEVASAREYEYISKYNKNFNAFVPEMIKATEFHFSGIEYSDLYTNILLDLDIIGFSDPYEQFKETQKTIDLEYKSIYTQYEIDKGRANFLKNILENKLLQYRCLPMSMTSFAYQNIERLLDERYSAFA